MITTTHRIEDNVLFIDPAGKCHYIDFTMSETGRNESSNIELELDDLPESIQEYWEDIEELAQNKFTTLICNERAKKGERTTFTCTHCCKATSPDPEGDGWHVCAEMDIYHCDDCINEIMSANDPNWSNLDHVSPARYSILATLPIEGDKLYRVFAFSYALNLGFLWPADGTEPPNFTDIDDKPEGVREVCLQELNIMRKGVTS